MDGGLKELPRRNVSWSLVIPDGDVGEVVIRKEDGTIMWKEETKELSASLVFKILCKSMNTPITNEKPYRPSKIILEYSDRLVGFGTLAQLLAMFSISLLDPHLPREPPPKQDNTSRICSFCRTNVENPFMCGDCKAVFYCSQDCQKSDWEKTEKHGDNHKTLCKRMALHCQRGEFLKKLPFTFAEASTAGKILSAVFWNKWKIHRVGFWRFECDCCPSPPFAPLPPEFRTTGLTPNFLPLPFPLVKRETIHNWKQYYTLRNIPFNSPIAFLLTYPLTVFHILTNLLPERDGAPNPFELEKEIVIHYLGAEKEVGQIPMWRELHHLLPEHHIRLAMIGPKIPKHLDPVKFEDTTEGSLTITFERTLYHFSKQRGRKPTVIIGCNAGLAAYPEWKDTVAFLVQRKLPTFFSDYCEYSCELAFGNLNHFGECDLTYPIEANPFRRPANKFNQDNNLPWYGNGFVFGIY